MIEDEIYYNKRFHIQDDIVLLNLYQSEKDQILLLSHMNYHTRKGERVNSIYVSYHEPGYGSKSSSNVYYTGSNTFQVIYEYNTYLRDRCSDIMYPSFKKSY